MALYRFFPKERMACYPYPVYMWGFLSLLTVWAPRMTATTYTSWVLLASLLQTSCLPIVGFQIPRNTWWPRTQLSTSYVSIYCNLVATRLKCEYAYTVRVICDNFLFDRVNSQILICQIFIQVISGHFAKFNGRQISRYTVRHEQYCMDVSWM